MPFLTKRFFFAIVFTAVAAFTSASAEIKESEVAGQSRIFMSKILKDNPGQEQSIRSFMSGIIRNGNAGVRIIDKFGLFMYDSRSNHLSLVRIRYASRGSSASMFIVMKDNSDGQLYNLFIEYTYNSSRKSYTLGDLYFSSVFMDRINSVRNFFGGD